MVMMMMLVLRQAFEGSVLRSRDGLGGRLDWPVGRQFATGLGLRRRMLARRILRRGRHRRVPWALVAALARMDQCIRPIE